MSDTTTTATALNTVPPDTNDQKFNRRNTMALVGAAVSALIATAILATFLTTDLGSRGVPGVVQIVQKYLRPRAKEGSFVNRRPVLTLMLVTVIVGFVLDAIIEIFMIRTGVLTYLQVVPFGSVWVGTRHQFPLLWQSLFTTIPFLIGALLWWRGRSGLSNAEVLSMLWSPVRNVGRFGTFLLIAAGLILGYLAFLTPYVIIHKGGWATGTAQPYLFCNNAVPDPKGLMRLNGQPGPHLAGWWPGPYLTEATREGPPPADACPHP